MVGKDDKRIFGERRVDNYEKGGESRLGIVCCDVEGMRMVSGMMNEELIGHEVGG